MRRCPTLGLGRWISYLSFSDLKLECSHSSQVYWTYLKMAVTFHGYSSIFIFDWGRDRLSTNKIVSPFLRTGDVLRVVPSLVAAINLETLAMWGGREAFLICQLTTCTYISWEECVAECSGWCEAGTSLPRRRTNHSLTRYQNDGSAWAYNGFSSKTPSWVQVSGRSSSRALLTLL